MNLNKNSVNYLFLTSRKEGEKNEFSLDFFFFFGTKFFWPWLVGTSRYCKSMANDGNSFHPLLNSTWNSIFVLHTAQNLKFSIRDFFSKCDQIRSLLRISSHLLKKSLMESFIFCTVIVSWLTWGFLKGLLSMSND